MQFINSKSGLARRIQVGWGIDIRTQGLGVIDSYISSHYKPVPL